MTPPRFLALLLLPTLAGSAVAAAAPVPTHIDVFTTSSLPIVGHKYLNRQLADSVIAVHRIDGVEAIKVTLSADLPGNPMMAKRAALRRMHQLDKSGIEYLRESADALVLVTELGVSRYPAIVLDQRWVVYGVTDLVQAYRLFQQSTNTNQP